VRLQSCRFSRTCAAAEQTRRNRLGLGSNHPALPAGLTGTNEKVQIRYSLGANRGQKILLNSLKNHGPSPCMLPDTNRGHPGRHVCTRRDKGASINTQGGDCSPPFVLPGNVLRDRFPSVYPGPSIVSTSPLYALVVWIINFSSLFTGSSNHMKIRPF